MESGRESQAKAQAEDNLQGGLISCTGTGTSEPRSSFFSTGGAELPSSDTEVRQGRASPTFFGGQIDDARGLVEQEAADKGKRHRGRSFLCRVAGLWRACFDAAAWVVGAFLL